MIQLSAAPYQLAIVLTIVVAAGVARQEQAFASFDSIYFSKGDANSDIKTLDDVNKDLRDKDGFKIDYEPPKRKTVRITELKSIGSDKVELIKMPDKAGTYIVEFDWVAVNGISKNDGPMEIQRVLPQLTKTANYTGLNAEGNDGADNRIEFSFATTLPKIPKSGNKYSFTISKDEVWAWGVFVERAHVTFRPAEKNARAEDLGGGLF